ncbi:MAG: DUF6702 family protein [Runella sp.]
MNPLMRNGYKFSFILCCFFFAASTYHDFHTSITRIDFNAKERSFEVSIRVFTDDLENALSKENGGKKFVIANNDKNDTYVEKYIEKRFAFLSPQKQKKAMSYIGKEQEADATWIYVEVPFGESIAGFSIQNDIMFELFDDQVNLVNINYNGTRRSYIFKAKEPVHLLGL